MLVMGGVQPAFAASNDNFVDATEIGSLPFQVLIDGYSTTYESGEPIPNCGYGNQPNSAWFSFTPSTNVTLIAYSGPSGVVAVYTGPTLNSLTPIACNSSEYSTLTLQAQANVTYYFQLSQLYLGSRYFGFSLKAAPPPFVYAAYDPYDPSIFDSINFFADISDEAGIYGGTPAWDLGDGTTSDQYSFTHQYAKDGDYSVSLTYTTSDGRTGSASTTVQVRTRDVAITKFSVPQTAKSNTTKEIAVEVTNRRYSDNVQVQLYKGLPGGGEQLIGTLTIFVPARATRATLFKFSYTYTGCDATVGKVTFRTAATIIGGRDALPADTTLIRTTLVSGTKSPCGPITYP
jgi:hypothetical protein